MFEGRGAARRLDLAFTRSPQRPMNLHGENVVTWPFALLPASPSSHIVCRLTRQQIDFGPRWKWGCLRTVALVLAQVSLLYSTTVVPMQLSGSLRRRIRLLPTKLHLLLRCHGDESLPSPVLTTLTLQTTPNEGRVRPLLSDRPWKSPALS